MNAWLVLFLAVTVVLFALPLAPALLEWRWRHDAAPLKVVREHDVNVRIFAQRFRAFVGSHFPELYADPPPPARAGALANGERYAIADAAGAAPLTPADCVGQSVTRLLLGPGDLVLPGDMLYEKDVFARGTISCGARSVLRAMLAEGAIHCGDGCELLRWAHSGGVLAFGGGARLFGRVSADTAIELAADSRFYRLHAPVLRFGAPAPARAPAPAPAARLELDPARRDPVTGRWLLPGALTVPPAVAHDGDLVTRLSLHVGAGAHLGGSIKSNAALTLEGQVRVAGAVVATGALRIGPHCSVGGPVVGEGRVVIAAGTVIGSSEHPTSITAATIEIEEGAQVHGSIWARELGYVAPARPH